MDQPGPQWDPTSRRYYTPTYNPSTEQYELVWHTPSSGPLTPESISYNRQPNDFSLASFAPLAGAMQSASPATASPSLPLLPTNYNHAFGQPLPQSPPQMSFVPGLPSAYTQSPYLQTQHQHQHHRRGTSTSSGVLPRGTGRPITATDLGSPNLPHGTVDSSHTVRNKDFFCEGRVLAVMWNETAGTTALDYNTSKSFKSNKNINPVRFEDNLVYTEQRRFVVVRRMHEFCYACPIFTYGGRGTLKPGVRPQQHAIAYSVGEQAVAFEDEIKRITKRPIGIDMAQGEPNLDIASRIYFGIQHPVQYNIRVKNIGRVCEKDMPKLIGYWNEEHKRNDELQQPPEEALRESSSGGDVDEFAYDPKTNRVGYHSKHNPQSFHPKHNPHGFHHEKTPYCYHEHLNPCGYHSELNKNAYHPESNPYGFNPREVPQRYQYHETMNPSGYHSTLNQHGFHPQFNLYGYHPEETEWCYHPKLNPSGYHSKLNIFGYHPIVNPDGHHLEKAPHCFHPDYNPKGYHNTHNPHVFHPQHNPHVYNSKYNPFSFHETKNTTGFSADRNPFAYHPVHNLHGYHKEGNPFGFSTSHRYGYHPHYNSHGYHPQYNEHGYHPKRNPTAFHPQYMPQGYVIQDDAANVDPLTNALQKMGT